MFRSSVTAAPFAPSALYRDPLCAFERFIRLDDDRTRSTGGAGIGLYLSRRLARMMDGDLIVADTPSGTRMVLRLPNARHLAAAG